MFNFKIIIIIFLLISHSALLSANTERQWANAAILIDWAQTRKIADDNNYYEKNAFLGKAPKTGDVNKHFILSILVINLMGEYLPNESSKYFYIGIAGAETVNILNNHRIGIKLKF